MPVIANSLSFFLVIRQVTSELSPGDVLVIPVGHPITLVAKQNENLRMVGFRINAHENQRIFLVGEVML